ncbi:RnfH family protein [Bordetella tumulicola]|uniref:RnfH family protein n=1 Tax=Bordetella tumulicola TaxID=1649133 RepID=UPI0039EE788C
MANNSGNLHISVCYAEPSAVWQRALTLPTGATVQDALRESGLQAAFPDLDPWGQGVGVFGKLCQAETALADGDRIEVYRPLSFDPMVSRRRRAEHRRAKATAARNGRARPAGLL